MCNLDGGLDILQFAMNAAVSMLGLGLARITVNVLVVALALVAQ